MASLEGQGTDKRKNWRVIYYWQGQKKYIRIGITNRRTALLRKSQIETILASGLDPEVEIMKNADNVSISTLLTRDNEWCKHRRQQGTIDLNNFAMDQLIEFLGDIKISSISQNRIEKFLNYLRDDLGWKKSSCNIYLRHLKAIFQRAIDESKKLAKLKSITELFNFRQASPLPENESVIPKNIVRMIKSSGKNIVREGSF